MNEFIMKLSGQIGFFTLWCLLRTIFNKNSFCRLRSIPLSLFSSYDDKFWTYFLTNFDMVLLTGSLLLESKIQPDTAYQKQQVHAHYSHSICSITITKYTVIWIFIQNITFRTLFYVWSNKHFKTTPEDQYYCFLVRCKRPSWSMSTYYLEQADVCRCPWLPVF